MEINEFLCQNTALYNLLSVCHFWIVNHTHGWWLGDKMVLTSRCRRVLFLEVKISSSYGCLRPQTQVGHKGQTCQSSTQSTLDNTLLELEICKSTMYMNQEFIKESSTVYKIVEAG